MHKKKLKNTNPLFLLLCIFCLVEGNSDLKQTSQVFGFGDLKESYAELSHDPRANLPEGFTICSTIRPGFTFPNDMHVFFYLFDINGSALLNSVIQIIMTKGDVDTIHNWGNRKDLENGKRSLRAFPNRWIKQCASFNRTSGLYQVVVDGVFVTNQTLPEDKVQNVPTDLSGKLFVGNRLELSSTKTKVTNLNIYSNVHSIEVMRSNTKRKTCIV